MEFADWDKLLGERQSYEWWIDSAEIGQMVEGAEREDVPIIYAHFFVKKCDQPPSRTYSETVPAEMWLLYIGERASAKSFKSGMKAKAQKGTYKWKKHYTQSLIYSVYWPLLDSIFKSSPETRKTLESFIHEELSSLFRLCEGILPCNAGMQFHKEKANLRILHQCKYLILADIMTLWPVTSKGCLKTGISEHLAQASILATGGGISGQPCN